MAPDDVRRSEDLVRREPETVEELLEAAERVLGCSVYIDAGHDVRATVEELLAACLDDPQPEPTHRPPRRLRERYLAWVARRSAGEPVGLIVGRVSFCDLDLEVQPGCFVPRPSATIAVDRALHHLDGRPSPTMVDLGTGVGPIALAVAHRRPDAAVWGVDLSERALRVARRNARRNGVGGARFAVSDLFGALPRRLRGRVDVVVGNIPFVRPDEIPEMPAEIAEYEPLSSLTDLSEDGMGLLERAVPGARRWLAPGGWLLVEVSEDTAEPLAALCAAAGFEVADPVTSDTSWDVMVEARKPV